MLKGSTPSYKSIGRIGLVLVITIAGLTMTAASTNAAGFSFMESMKEFFGFEAATATAPAPALMPPISDLFISEYVEGTSNDKAIEIYNGTGSNITFSSGPYTLEVYANGSATATSTITLTSAS